MIYFHWVFYVFAIYLLALFNFFKYWLYRLLTPIVKWELTRRLKKVGLTIDGKDARDIQVYSNNAYARVGTYYTLGLGEAYMNKEGDCKDIKGAMMMALRSKHWGDFVGFDIQPYFNLQTPHRAFFVGKFHYDLDDEFFEAMLDSNMQYSCGYWKDATTLQEAQEAKLDLIARKLMLKPGMTILDIGCGWGCLAKYLAERYDVSVVGITISEGQAQYARKKMAHPNVEITVMDYRTMKRKFDRIVSVGMFEHVGAANYKTYFKVANRCLKEDGIFLLHTMGVCDKYFPTTEPFNDKYVFPNSACPRQNVIMEALTGQFYVEDWHNFGHDYSLTIDSWLAGFKKAWPTLDKSKYDEKFYRMWEFYLSCGSALFASRKFNLWQIVLSKNGLEGGYRSVR